MVLNVISSGVWYDLVDGLHEWLENYKLNNANCVVKITVKKSVLKKLKRVKK